MTLDLLVLSPHPDDAELCCGGLLALCAQRSQRAGILDLTRGELSSNGTPEERAVEAAAAHAVLGLELRENLALPDGGLQESDREQVDALVAEIRRLRPGLLVGPWTEARHPDHRAAGALARTAHFLAGLRKHRPDLGAAFRPKRLLHYPMRHEAPADLVVDISSVFETKVRAIACHSSQFQGVETLLNGEVGGQAFAVRDRYWGASIGVAHGEPYVLGGPVPVADPVAHFEDHDALPALVPNR